jgi:hypothetical protein
MKQQLPVVGNTYNNFDDGKIRESRRYPVIITEIVPASQIDADTIAFWNDEVSECDWLYATETDYFIKGLLDVGEIAESVTYVRTIDGRWFSLGWWGGILDIDGTLLKSTELISADYYTQCN